MGEGKNKRGCKSCYTISRKDFCKNGIIKKSFVISKSGKYCLTEDISFSPEIEETAAIVINSDNVQLNLCGFTLKQENIVNKTTGILVLTGHKNITIIGSNGTISNFSNLGIYVQGGNKNIQIGNDNSKFFIVKNGGKSEVIDGGIRVGETFFYKVYFNDPSSVYHGVIENLTINNLICEENFGYGMSLGNNINSLINNSSFSKNIEFRTTSDPAGSLYIEAYGLILIANESLGDIGWNNLTIDNCLFNRNFCDTRDRDINTEYTSGLRLSGSGKDDKNLIIRNSQFNHNTLGKASNTTVDGCNIRSKSDINIENCQFSYNVSGNNTVGANLGSLNGSITITNSKFSNNVSSFELCKSLTYQYLSGIDFKTCDSATINNCIIVGNSLLTNQLSDDKYEGEIHGIGLVGIKNQNILISECHITSNKCDTILGEGFSAGIYTFDNLFENISIIGCVISDNSLNTNNINFLNVGIYNNTFDSNINGKFLNIKNCTISNHKTTGVRIKNSSKTNIENNDISQNGTGVQLRGGSNCSTVIGNTFTNNGQAVSDTDLISTSLIGSNRGFNNGIVPYNVIYSFGNCPVKISDLTIGFPSLPTFSMENVEVTGSCPF